MEHGNTYTLEEIFQDGMLFQREKEIVVRGTAEPDCIVIAAVYREGEAEAVRRGTCVADHSGQFSVALPPMEAGEGYFLDVLFDAAPERTIRLSDIAFGDIWLAGGQSNMEFFLKYDKDWEKTQKLPRNPKIRMYNVPQRSFAGHTSHNKTGYGYWFDDGDPALACFSAPAYSFARDVQPAIGIPIGLIGCNWGGSSASTWVEKEMLQTPPLPIYLKEYEQAIAGISEEKLAADSFAAWAFEDSEKHHIDFEPLLYGRDRDWQLQYMEAHKDEPVVPMGPYHFNRPAGLYEMMLHPLFSFPIKGVLWYQGESDAGEKAYMYDILLTNLVNLWRKKWNDELPFLIVQLAPFGVWRDCISAGYAVVREKQAAVAETVPGVYMASIMDLGDYYDIHPKEKMEVGRRLALLARGHIYGESGLLCDAPKAVDAVFLNESQIAVTFCHADGLFADGKDSDWKIRLPKQDVAPTKVLIEGERIVLTLPFTVSPEMSPAYVSLGFDDYAEIHIFNRAGLSAAPFQKQIRQGESL